MKKIGGLSLMLALLAGSSQATEDVDGSLSKLAPASRASLLDVMDRELVDGPSSRYRDVKGIAGGRICGLVNSKNRLGAYAGYQRFIYNDPERRLIMEGKSPPGDIYFLDVACPDLTTDEIKKLLRPKP